MLISLKELIFDKTPSTERAFKANQSKFSKQTAPNYWDQLLRAYGLRTTNSMIAAVCYGLDVRLIRHVIYNKI